MPTATQGQATIEIDAPPLVAYDLLSDVTRMGERSPECYRCEWLGFPARPEVDARFKGFNRLGLLRWSTTCVVIKAERGREFAFTVLSGRGRAETQWRYAITAT